MPSKILVDYKSPLGPRVVQVRSTLIASSLQSLREAGHYDRYVELLPKEHHEAILLTIAPEWLPAELAVVHYGTCDALNLSDAELEKMGEAVSTRIMGTFLGTMVRSSRNVGMTPWVALGQYERLWTRLLNGGTCSVEQVGPKDAIVRSHGAPMFEQRYFRTAYQGVIKGASQMFARAVTARTSRVPGHPHSVVTTVSWV